MNNTYYRVFSKVKQKNMFYADDVIAIFFGNERYAFVPAEYKQYDSVQLLYEQPFFEVKNRIALKRAVFLHQVHGTQGFVVSNAHVHSLESMKTFCTDGDFLVSNLPGVGLGVATADCLPIILYDPIQNVVSNVHAGWRGAVGSIAIRALESMNQNFGSNLKNIKVFFGPSAHACCYVVGADFANNLSPHSFADQVMEYRQGRAFFNLPLFNKILLEQNGIKSKNIHLQYALCTICNPSFCSVRRINQTPYRQMTIVALKQ